MQAEEREFLCLLFFREMNVQTAGVHFTSFEIDVSFSVYDQCFKGIYKKSLNFEATFYTKQKIRSTDR